MPFIAMFFVTMGLFSAKGNLGRGVISKFGILNLSALS